jgi:hypothetical protein
MLAVEALAEMLSTQRTVAGLAEAAALKTVPDLVGAAAPKIAEGLAVGASHKRCSVGAAMTSLVLLPWR